MAWPFPFCYLKYEIAMPLTTPHFKTNTSEGAPVFPLLHNKGTGLDSRNLLARQSLNVI